MTATLTITEPGLVDGMPDDVYHGDPVPSGSLSASGAKKLLPPSCPAKFRYEQDNPPEPKKTFEFGHAAHRLVLGRGVPIKVIPDDVADSRGGWTTTAAKALVAEARENGQTPLKPEEWDTVQAMAAAIKAHPVASRLFDPARGKAEQSAFWVDEASGIWRRARFDFLPHVVEGRRLIIPDYKTAVSAERDKFARAASDYGYHQQAAWYLDAIKALKGEEDAVFVFVVQEKTAPYLVNVIQLDHNAIAIGDLLNRRAINTYARCVAEDHWPGYSDDVQLAQLPAYYERQFEGDLS